MNNVGYQVSRCTQISQPDSFVGTENCRNPLAPETYNRLGYAADSDEMDASVLPDRNDSVCTFERPFKHKPRQSRQHHGDAFCKLAC